MLDFTFYNPTKYIFGKGVESRVGAEIARLKGTKVLIHYGSGSVVRSGLLQRVKESLDASGIAYVDLGGVVPNPRDSKVYEGIELCRKEGVDFILGVGGGSAIDSAKAIGVGVNYDGDFWDFYMGGVPVPSMIPLGVVLTMAAAGSEGSKSSVITKEEGQFKRSIDTDVIRPSFAILNPELTMTLPAYQTAAGAVDMMAHVLERYFTHTPDVDLTDRLCEAVLSAVLKAAPEAIANPSDYGARAELMWAGTVAHNDTVGVGRAGDWASHQIEHELSALYDVAHGAGLAVVFPAWMRYQLPKHPARFAQLAVRVFGCDMDYAMPERTGMEGIERFERFLIAIGMPITLKQLGAKTEDIPFMAAKVRRGPKGTTGGFSPLDTAAIEKIFKIANK